MGRLLRVCAGFVAGFLIASSRVSPCFAQTSDYSSDVAAFVSDADRYVSYSMREPRSASTDVGTIDESFPRPDDTSLEMFLSRKSQVSAGRADSMCLHEQAHVHELIWE